MPDLLPAAQNAAAVVPAGRRSSTWLVIAIALCALVAGAAAAVVIYAVVDDEAVAPAPQPSTVVVPMHSTTAAEIAAAKAMDRQKNEARTAVAISGEQPLQSGTLAKDESKTAAAVGQARTDTDAPTSSLAGVGTPTADEAKVEAAAKADTMSQLGAQP